MDSDLYCLGATYSFSNKLIGAQIRHRSGYVTPW